MAKKKTSKAKPIPIKLPVPHDRFVLPEKIVAVPVCVEPAKVAPLPEPHGPIRCVATLWVPIVGASYVILAPMDGQELPKVSEDGQIVDVQFSPPSRF